jgi:hypothetical protein
MRNPHPNQVEDAAAVEMDSEDDEEEVEKTQDWNSSRNCSNTAGIGISRNALTNSCGCARTSSRECQKP